MTSPPSVWALSVHLVIVCAKSLSCLALTCVDPSTIRLPTHCPIVLNPASLDLYKVRNSEFPSECSGEGGPTIFAPSNSFVYFHCCFSGYRKIVWQFSASPDGPFTTPKCLGRYDNYTFMVYIRAYSQYSGYYRCEAVGANGERRSMVQRLSVLLKVEDKSIDGPQFDRKCDQEIEVTQGRRVECGLNVSVTRKAKIFIQVMAAEQLTFTCIYQPFCDRLRKDNLTEAMCHRNRSSNLQIGFKTDPKGSALRVSLAPMSGLPSNVTFVAWDETLPQDTTEWTIHTKPLPPDVSALYIIFSSSVLVLVFAALLASVWIFALNIQLILKGLRFKLKNIKPSVRILSHPGCVDFVDDLSDYLEKSCDVKQDLVGLPDCEITMKTGVDKTCVYLIILDVWAVSHEPFIARMNCLLLRESARRVYVSLDSINNVEKNTAGNKDSRELVKRIKADLKFCSVMSARRRPWKWTRWQVVTCLKLAAISILSKLDPEVMLNTSYPSISSDSGLGSTSSDFN